MFRKRKTRAALLVDYDNVSALILGGKRIENWVHWLEDGRFDDSGAPRTLVEKRVYFNEENESLVNSFSLHGFDCYPCPAVVEDKSAVDMVLALDAMEIAQASLRAHSAKKVDEFIILTRDSDFVPLVDRLSKFEHATVILAESGSPRITKAYVTMADFAVPSNSFRGARDYVRSKPSGLWARFTALLRSLFLRDYAVSGPGREKARGRLKATSDLAADRRKAAEAVVDLGLQTKTPLPHKTIRLVIARALGEPTTPKEVLYEIHSRLSYGSFAKMIRGLAQIDQRIRCRNTKGGLQVSISAQRQA